MEQTQSPWAGRTVLVAGGETLLGKEVTRELLTRGAIVVGLVRARAAAAPFASEVLEKRFRIVHGRCEDAARIQSILAIHEVSAVFALGLPVRDNSAIMRAARFYHSRVPVVTAPPTFQLRLAGDRDVPQLFHGIARFGEVFGPGDGALDGVVSRTAQAILRGYAVPAADGPPRDFVFSRDAALACLATAQQAGAGSSADFTFHSGWVFTEVEMARVIRDVLGGRLAEPESVAPANPLGWKPSTSLSEAVAATLSWYRDQAKAVAQRRAA